MALRTRIRSRAADKSKVGQEELQLFIEKNVSRDDGTLKVEDGKLYGVIDWKVLPHTTEENSQSNSEKADSGISVMASVGVVINDVMLCFFQSWEKIRYLAITLGYAFNVSSLKFHFSRQKTFTHETQVSSFVMH